MSGRPGTLREAIRRSGVLDRVQASARQLRERTDRMNDLLRRIEDQIRVTPGACNRVVAVSFEHPSYDDPHELAWSSRRGRWRLVLVWGDGSEPVLGASREVRAAVLGSDALRILMVKLGTRYAITETFA